MLRLRIWPCGEWRDKKWPGTIFPAISHFEQRGGQPGSVGRGVGDSGIWVGCGVGNGELTVGCGVGSGDIGFTGRGLSDGFFADAGACCLDHWNGTTIMVGVGVTVGVRCPVLTDAPPASSGMNAASIRTITTASRNSNGFFTVLSFVRLMSSA